jgi:protein-L-isoaspartate(D-aspartate) O-methyltransferase
VGRLEEARQRYAEELRSTGALRPEPLVRAFATVPREHYLGPGPWKLLEPRDVGAGYRPSENGDTVCLYRNVLVAIDPTRRLNNGEPLAPARWLDRSDPCPGDRVLHVGCGVGYYTAVLAEVVGPSGDVLALEIDRELAARARANLARDANVEVVCAGARDEETNEALRQAYTNGAPESVRSLRRDLHDADAGCWLHFEGRCLSREAGR